MALSKRATLTLTPTHLLALLALLTAAPLLWLYLALLHDAVERGARFRAQASLGTAARPLVQLGGALGPVGEPGP